MRATLAPFRHVWPHLRRQRGLLLLGLACLIPAKLIDLTIPLIWKRGFDGAIDRSLGFADEVRLALLALGIGIVSSVLAYATRRFLVNASREFERDVRLQLHQKLLTLPPQWFGKTTVGDLVSRMTQDIEAVRMLGPGLMYLANAVVALGGAFTFMLWHDPRLTLWMGLPFGLLAVIALAMAPRLGRASDKVQEGIGRISAGSAESFSAIRVLKVFTGEERAGSRMVALSRDYFDAQMRLAAARGGMISMLLLMKDSAYFVILLVGGIHVLGLGGEATLGDLIAYRGWLIQSFWPLFAFGWMISIVQRAAAAMRRIAEVLETPPEIASPARPRAAERPSERSPGRALPIEWRDVTVHLGGRRVLDRVSLSVPAGTSLGITGRTGSGKTTLVQLAVRLLDPESGVVTVGGIDVRDWDLDALRRAVGFVPQEPFLFSDLLRENLRFARPDASEQEVLDGVRTAGLEPDLEALGAGLETRVGERGVTLSGGQRQRTALARTLLVDPPAVILDDALSAVDAETEARILERLRGELSGRTAVVVSHRMAAIAGLDRIAVLEDGRLVELGTHDELVRLGGRFARLERDQRLLAELEAL